MNEQLTLVEAKTREQGLNPKQKWKRAFQRYCDSSEIREESQINGINACGYGIQCDFCEGAEKRMACAKAMIEYANDEKIAIDYERIDKSYFRKLLTGEN